MKSRNLIVLGNGFDLSLGLNSTFKDYIGAGKVPNPEYHKIHKFIELYFKYRNELVKKLQTMMNKYKGERHYRINNYPYKYVLRLKPSIYLKGGMDCKKALKHLADNYFTLRLYLKDYKINIHSFELFNLTAKSPFKMDKNVKDQVNLDLKNINKVGNTYTKRLLNITKRINTNFWNLLIIFQQIFAKKWQADSPNSTDVYFNNWYDVENMIKDFLISAYNKPELDKYGNYRYHDLDFFVNVGFYNYFSRACFSTYNYINEYFYLLAGSRMYIDELSGVHDSYSVYKNVVSKSRLSNILLGNNNDNNIGNPYSLYNPLIFLMKSCCNYDPSNKTDSMNNNLIDFLHKQVGQFENEFSKYLTKEICKFGKSKYINKSYRLLKGLNHLNIKTNNLFKLIYKHINRLLSCSVLDFNYTPISKDIKDQEHIHGSLNHNNIVIGLGENQINDIKNSQNNFGKSFANNEYDYEYRNALNSYIYNRLFMFSKTARLFTVTHKSISEFFNNVNNIIFFGHSLGINDYPYFEALFDGVHLYSNTRVKLIFCYSRHGKRKNNKQWFRDKQCPNIIYLLKLYSKTMTNKAHGQNLISKMLLENRIKLKDVTDLVKDI